MKSNSLLVVGLGTLLAASGWAQTAPPIRVQVPFEFSAGPTKLPAGEYRVSVQVPGVLKVAAENGKNAILLFANAAEKSNGAGGPALIFNRYGDHYFLSQVWGQEESGYQLRTTKAEKEYAKVEDRKLTRVTAALR